MSKLLHQEIAQTLKQSLETGQWRRGQKLPNERTLAADMGCAVGTLRRALEQLELEGLLERTQGRGTFVAQLPATAQYSLFYLQLNAGSGRPSARVIERSARSCPVDLPSAQHIRRERFLNDQLVAIEDIWVRLERPLALDEGDNALYQTLAGQYGVWIRSVQDRISVAQRADIQAFGLPAVQGFVARHSWDIKGDWVEYSETYFNPEVAHYSAQWKQ